MNLLTIQIQDDTRNPQPGASTVGPGVTGAAGGRPQQFAPSAFSPAYPPNPVASQPPRTPAPVDARRTNPDLDEAMGFQRPASPTQQFQPPASVAPQPANAGAGGTGADADQLGWYKRYRELQNQYDRFEQEGRKLRDAEAAELERLRKKLEEVSRQPAYGGGGAGGGGAGNSPGGASGSDVRLGYSDLGERDPNFVGPPRPETPRHADEGVELTDKPPLPRGKPVSRPVRAGAAADEAGVSAADILKTVGQFLPGRGGQLASAVGQYAGSPAAGAGAGAGAAEAGAMAGMGRLAAAAGPIGIALLAAKMATDEVQHKFQQLANTVEGVGVGMKRLAANDHVGLLTDRLDAAAKSLDDIPMGGLAVKALAGEFKVASAAVKAYTGAVDAFTTRGREIASYDARIAGAFAVADARNTIADAREARAMGANLGKLVEAENRLSLAVREGFLPFKVLGAKILATLETKLANAMERLAPLLEASAKAAEKGWDFTEKNWPHLFGAVGFAGKALVDLADSQKKQQQQDAISEMMKDIFLIGSDLPETPFGPDPARDAKSVNSLPPVLGGP